MPVRLFALVSSFVQSAATDRPYSIGAVTAAPPAIVAPIRATLTAMLLMRFSMALRTFVVVSLAYISTNAPPALASAELAMRHLLSLDFVRSCHARDL